MLYHILIATESKQTNRPKERLAILCPFLYIKNRIEYLETRYPISRSCPTENNTKRNLPEHVAYGISRLYVIQLILI